MDLHASELRKQGLKIKIRDQPFQILLLLLAQPGEVVSREELQKQLWRTDTFVDFDHGLNKAVNHLRDALGDSAESPRFIETLPKRGYRFIAPVDAGHPNGHLLEPILETQHAPAEPPERWAHVQPLGERRAIDRLKLKLWAALPWIIAGLLSVGVVISVVLLWRATRPPNRPLMRFSIDLGPEAIRGRADNGEFFNPVISPDGARLVFPAKAADGREQLATRRLDQPVVTMLAGTEGAFDPFFSPDGQWIGFFAGKKLRKIPSQGGAVVSLCDTAGLERGAAWGEDGAIIANLDNYHLFRVPANGGGNHGALASRNNTASGPGVGRRFCPAVRTFCSQASSQLPPPLTTAATSKFYRSSRDGSRWSGAAVPLGAICLAANSYISIKARFMGYRSTSGVWRRTARRCPCWRISPIRIAPHLGGYLFPGPEFSYTRTR